MVGRSDPRSDAVSSVVGTVLMLGITLAVFAGFSLFALDSVSEDQRKLRADLGVVQEGDNVLLQHRGGDALDLGLGLLQLTVDGSETELPLADLADQTEDGTTWRIGETLCLAGPQPPCQYGEGQLGRVVLVYENAIVLADGETDSGLADAVLTYVASASPTTGTVTALASAQSSTDVGAEALLTEGGTAVAGGSVGPLKLSGAVASTGGAIGPTSAQGSNDAWAELDTTGDSIEVSTFDLPSNTASITSITIGYEGHKDGNGGQDPTMRLDYKVGTGSYDLGTTFTETSTTDVDRNRTLSGTFTPSQVENLTVRLVLVTDENRNPLIDHLFVRVAYVTSATTTYALDVAMDVTGVPSGLSHELQVDYRVSGDTVRVQVWDGSSFTTRATLTATTSTTWTHTLTASEYNAGAPRIRFLDSTASGTTQGILRLDYVRVVTT